LEILPDDLKLYAETVSSTLKEGPNAVLTPTNSVIVAEAYKNIIGYTDEITGKFISSKSTLINGFNTGDDTENTNSVPKKKRKNNVIRLKFLNVVNSYHDKVFYRA
jgi:PKD repeat protein